MQSVPSNGLPIQTSPPPAYPASEEDDFFSAVCTINKILESLDMLIEFDEMPDDNACLRLVDRRTHETLRNIPPNIMLRIVSSMGRRHWYALLAICFQMRRFKRPSRWESQTEQ
jgi:hypothetical protein